MSVLEMRKVAIVGLAKDSESMMKSLQDAGVLHITPSSNENCDQVSDDEIEKIKEIIDKLTKSINFLKESTSSTKAFPKKCDDVTTLLNRIAHLNKEHEESKKNIVDLKNAIETYSPFGLFLEDHNVLSKIGWQLKLARLSDKDLNILKKNTNVFHLIKRIKELNYIALFLDKNAQPEVAIIDPPNKSIVELKADLKQEEEKLALTKNKAASWYYQLRTLETYKKEILEEYARLIELKKARLENGLIGISGFILKNQIDDLKRTLNNHVVAIKFKKPDLDQDVPVKLKNPKSLCGFEAIVKSFTGINYFEKDKTIIVALLFMLFGSLCFLDAGYGFLLMVVGYVIAIKKNRDFGQVFLWTGVASLTLGILCGQVFGLIFKKDIFLTTPPLFSLATDPMVCFKFSLIVGLLALALTNMVAIYQNGIRNHALGSLLAIFAIFTIILDQGGYFSTKFSDINILNILTKGFGAFCVLSWIVFPEPVFGKKKRIPNILWMLYSGPIGIVQDILSHMRLFGIALSGSILALVINKISLLLPSFLGILFAPIGHGIVFFLSLLSLYIHTNRLIFLEFGSKCMNGGHNFFEPFSRRI
jgi:V/A-type H+/Na+-transporting ATPase subunit I